MIVTITVLAINDLWLSLMFDCAWCDWWSLNVCVPGLDACMHATCMFYIAFSSFITTNIKCYNSAWASAKCLRISVSTARLRSTRDWRPPSKLIQLPFEDGWFMFLPGRPTWLFLGQCWSCHHHQKCLAGQGSAGVPAFPKTISWTITHFLPL